MTLVWRRCQEPQASGRGVPPRPGPAVSVRTAPRTRPCPGPGAVSGSRETRCLRAPRPLLWGGWDRQGAGVLAGFRGRVSCRLGDRHSHALARIPGTKPLWGLQGKAPVKQCDPVLSGAGPGWSGQVQRGPRQAQGHPRAPSLDPIWFQLQEGFTGCSRGGSFASGSGPGPQHPLTHGPNPGLWAQTTCAAGSFTCTRLGGVGLFPKYTPPTVTNAFLKSVRLPGGLAVRPM